MGPSPPGGASEEPRGWAWLDVWFLQWGPNQHHRGTEENANSGSHLKPLGPKSICISNRFLGKADDAFLGITAGSVAWRAIHTALLWCLSHCILAHMALSPLPGPGQLLLWVCPPRDVYVCICSWGNMHLWQVCPCR